jgi:outer membrane protein assembly factor BamB
MHKIFFYIFIVSIFITIGCNRPTDSETDGVELLWKQELDESVTSGIVIDGNYLYFQGSTSRLFKIGRNGKGLQSFNTLNGASFGIPVIFNDFLSAGTSFSGANAGSGAHLYMLSKETLKPIWEKHNFYWNPIPVMDEKYLYCTEENGIYAFNKETGEEVWKTEIYGRNVYNPMVEDNRIYFATGSIHRQDGYLYCINKLDGSIVFRDTLTYMEERSQWGGSSGGVGIWKDYVYVPSDNWYLYCFNKNNGNEIWKFLADSPMETVPRVSDSILYFGSLNATCYAIDAEKGKLIWSYQTIGSIRRTPTQFYKDYVLFVSLGAILILEKKSGKLVVKLSSATGPYSYATAVWDTDGKIYTEGYEEKTQKHILIAYKFK